MDSILAAPSDPQAEALAVIAAAEPTYRRILHLTESQPGWQSPAAYCHDVLVRALVNRTFLATPRRRAFFATATASRPQCRLTPVLAALDHRARGERPAAFAYAKRALILNQDDLYAQELWLATHPEPPRREPLTERFCEFPFERFETQSAGRVMFCCPAWLPAPFGNLRDGSPGSSGTPRRPRTFAAPS